MGDLTEFRAQCKIDRFWCVGQYTANREYSYMSGHGALYLYRKWTARSTARQVSGSTCGPCDWHFSVTDQTDVAIDPFRHLKYGTNLSVKRDSTPSKISHSICLTSKYTSFLVFLSFLSSIPHPSASNLFHQYFLLDQ